MKFRILVTALVVGCLGLGACANTVRGVGKDVNSTAAAVDDSVR